MIDFWSYRPCGLCRELVPYPEGCPHWKPEQGAKAAAARQRRLREQADLEAFRRQMRLGAT